MIRLDLAESEARILKETLQSDLARVRMEYGKTESRDWRHALQEKEQTLLKLLENLEKQAQEC